MSGLQVFKNAEFGSARTIIVFFCPHIDECIGNVLECLYSFIREKPKLSSRQGRGQEANELEWDND